MNFNKCSYLRIYESYFLGNLDVAEQDTSELSSGAACTTLVTGMHTCMAWDRLGSAALCSAELETWEKDPC